MATQKTDDRRRTTDDRRQKTDDNRRLSAMATVKDSDKQPGFEKSLERLETIVREMESGELSLEKMMKHFEEGMSLVGICSTKLNEVERKIELLVKQGDQMVAKPFEVPPEPAEEK
ncbi:MAG: exodeoxyribonuclease VII small subunit [Verrucomicrobiota bacterium]